MTIREHLQFKHPLSTAGIHFCLRRKCIVLKYYREGSRQSAKPPQKAKWWNQSQYCWKDKRQLPWYHNDLSAHLPRDSSTHKYPVCQDSFPEACTCTRRLLSLHQGHRPLYVWMDPFLPKKGKQYSWLFEKVKSLAMHIGTFCWCF